MGGIATEHESAVGQCGSSGMASDRHYALTTGEQQVHDFTPDVSRRSGNQDHNKLLSSVEGTLRWLNVNRFHGLSLRRDMVVMTNCIVVTPKEGRAILFGTVGSVPFDTNKGNKYFPKGNDGGWHLRNCGGEGQGVISRPQHGLQYDTNCRKYKDM
jgi:hypothetical protein